MSLQLSGLKVASSKKKDETPILPDPTGELLPLVSQAVRNKQIIEANEGALESASLKLKAAAFEHAITLYAGRTPTSSSFQIGDGHGKATLSLTNKYKMPQDIAPVKALIGKFDVLQQTYVVKINTEFIPPYLLQPFIDELVKLARSMDAMNGTEAGKDGPVFQAIEVLPQYKLAETFHARRHELLSVEDNRRLHQIMPCVAAMRLTY